MKVCDLTPGDKLTIGTSEAVFIGQIYGHPLYRSLNLVIWYLIREDRYSFDALHSQQELPGTIEVGALGVVADEVRRDNLVKALHEGQRR